MFAFAQYDAADLSDDTWVDLFPWLDEYESADAARLEEIVPNVSDWWIADTPRDTCSDADLDAVIAGLAGLAVRRHRTARFGDLAPRLDPTIPVAALRLGPRAETVVRRLGDRALVRTLLSATVESLFALKGTSPETVQNVAAGVLGAAILVAPESGVPSDHQTDNPVAVQLVDDLRVLARWRGLRGALGSPLIDADIEEDAPEEVQEVATRISAITGKDFVAAVEADPVDELENLIEQLGERETLALTEFVMAVKPISLGQLSVRLHLSKGRAGGIVAQLKQKLAAACEFETTAGGLLASMRAEIRPVTSLARLLDMQPVLRREVPTLGVPLWLALDRLDDGFEVTGPWAVAPDLRAARASTIVMLEQFESGNGVLPLETAARTLRLSTDEAREWLEYCEIPVLDDKVMVSTRRLVDHAAAILEVLGDPVDTAALTDLLDTDRSEQFVARHLADDERFSRTATGKWVLAELPEAVADAIPQSSVLCEADELDAAHESTDATIVVRPTRRLYRIGATWRFRLRVTAEHLRGSGFTIPVGLAQAFGCRQGELRELPSPLGTQMVRWTGTNPTCGTIRRFLTELSTRPKDIVFLTYSEDGGFDVVPCADVAPDDPLRGALALIGVQNPDDVNEAEAAPLLATAIGLESGTKPRRILSRYQTRDGTVAELLEAAWTVAVR